MTSLEDVPETRVALPTELLQFFNRAMRDLPAHAATVHAHGDEHGLPCTRVDPKWFFVEGPSDPDRREKWAAARGICAGCPVQVACREWALEGHEKGLWGGTTDGQRERERARRKAARGGSQSDAA